MTDLNIKTLADIPSRQAEVKPDSIALEFEDTRVSYAELDSRSNQVANAFVADGVPTQTNIALLDRNAETFFYVLFGAAKANLCMVTVNFRLTAGEVSYILEDSDAEYLFVSQEFLPIARECKARLDRVQKIVVLDGEGEQEGETGLWTWMNSQPGTAPVDRIPTTEDRAVQMYTSGTTGHPKGVMLTHACMVCAAEEGISVWPVMHEPDAAVLATMPLFHIAAANLCLAGLFAGGRAVILKEAVPDVVARVLAESRIRIVPLPPALIHAIIRLPDIHSYDLSLLDTLLIAGSGIAVELLKDAQEVLDCGFALSYGMTECCGGITYLSPKDCVHDAGKLLASAGRAFGNNRVRIVDTNRQPLPTGEIGEIACRSDRLMKGYWHRPEASEEAVDGEWYFSGDAGYLDEDGYLYVVDRIKDMVVSGGENIYPVEIENELLKHPAVSDVAIIGIPDEKWGESLLANVILEPGAEVTGEQLVDFLRGSLAGYKIPRRYEFVDAFPRNATGKVLKREMRASWQPAA
ncbi:long-chain-fatty-acid--CoA ligase [Parahaliea maris]|uniref:Long-chain-fatty-acid--CoA ligase n=1 Tax=Parahaliea maris TaxID=2716870 RepID=A0A5C8ZLQ3_9GAMM|nr:long-chain-fatty-acid--CoA ligase [Parahaliea maris]TXS89506.1 long-chain-fatty-acid--CoA ligase [Parahaliea maris]